MLRILTFNTQLRSWGMEVGSPPSLPPEYTAEERAGFIADNILASASQYDIVCLNEVFADAARDVLSDRLSGTYPYQVTKADLLYTELLRPGVLNSISNKLFDIVFQPLLDVASVLALKLEDSGLFLASRWPFDLLPVPQALIDAIGAQRAAELFPKGMLAVSFMTYADCDGGLFADCRSAKGVLWARVRRDDWHSFDIFASHTQADDKFVGEYAPARDRQLAAAWQFIKARTGGPPFPNPTFFLGDLNVPSGLAEDADRPPEWNAIFNTPGAPLTDLLRDQWGTVQCRGGSTGLIDPGYTADVQYVPLRQRLDIIAAHLGPDLITQHVAIDRKVATGPAGVDGVSYLSDHYPLGIDVGTAHEFAAPPTALKVSVLDFSDGDLLLGPGQVRWYRYDLQGTYEFRLIAEDPDVYYQVYLGDDLSTPRQPYRNEKHQRYGDRFVLVAPFFVKVGHRRRDSEFIYRFRSHRHEGRDPDDALIIIPGVPYPETFPAAQQLNGDSPVSPWDDTDTKWFLLETPRVPIEVMTVSVTLTVDAGSGPLLLRVAQRDGAGMATLVEEAAPTTGTSRIEWHARPDESFYVCVQRQDPAFAAVSFQLLADIDVNLLFAGEAKRAVLLCEEETGGWGADDISLRMMSDSGWSKVVSNDEIGDFEGGAVRDLEQWLPPIVAYKSAFTVTVVEEDDIDSDDTGVETIPPYAQLRAWNRWQPLDPKRPADSTGRLIGAVSIDVDDGTYSLRCMIGRWSETL